MAWLDGGSKQAGSKNWRQANAEPAKGKALASCALLQNPMLDDPEHEWCACL
jgi:hypothetical protein